MARDNLEAHSITIKPRTSSHVVEQFSWVLLPSCSPPRHPFPIKSLALSACVSPWTIHFLVLDKSPLSGPRRGPTSRHMLSVLERETKRKTERQTEARPTSTLAFDPLPHAQPSPCLPTYSPIFTHLVFITVEKACSGTSTRKSIYQDVTKATENPLSHYTLY